MIGSTHRFHGLGSLRRTYKLGRTVRNQLMAIKFMPNDRRQTYRCAVVVSKKVSKSAVVRNRIRRRIFEVIRLAEPKITKSYDMVVTVYGDQVAEMDAQELTRTLNSLLTQAGVVS